MIDGALKKRCMTPAPLAERLPGGMHLRFMRGFQLSFEDQVVPLPKSCERLVAFLGLQDRPLPRHYVAGMLWLDSSEERSNARLRTTLWRLRRSGHHLVDLHGDTIRLVPEISVDVREFSGWARRLEGGHECICDDELEELVQAKELLPGWYDDWVVIERERARQMRLQLLDLACERLAACGRFAQAVAAGLAAVAEEPLRESAHQVLISAHLAQGNRSEALRQYAVYAEVLERELGLTPTSEMARLTQFEVAG
jgi:DNA-binding SARP family transcriptional activator